MYMGQQHVLWEKPSDIGPTKGSTFVRALAAEQNGAAFSRHAKRIAR